MGNTISNMGNCSPRKSQSPVNQWTINKPHTHSGHTRSLTHLSSMRDVNNAICRSTGAERPGLILGLDFTESNQRSGDSTFGGKSLHTVLDTPDFPEQNPYRHTLRVVMEALTDPRDKINAFGFGDKNAADVRCFPFRRDGQACEGFEQVLQRYDVIADGIQMGEVGSLAPVINEAIKIVRASQRFHVLVMITDGQISDDDTSFFSGDTIKAIVDASELPLSIVIVGVGDGPWDTMQNFSRSLPKRRFDNMHFVQYNNSIPELRDQSTIATSLKKASMRLAADALAKVPKQYRFVHKKSLVRPMQTCPQEESNHAFGSKPMASCRTNLMNNTIYPVAPPAPDGYRHSTAVECWVAPQVMA